MNDKRFLQSIVSAVELMSTAIQDQMVGIKNTDSINLYCSKSFADAIGTTQESIVGSTFCTEKLLDIVISEDQMVFESRKSLAFLKIYNFNNIIKPLIFIKFPIINPSTHNLVGLLFQVFEYGITHSFHQQIGNLYNLFATNEKQASVIKLSKREKQVIFLFLAHLSSQEIAETLYKIENKRVTKSTIDSIFTDQLYLKFNVASRIALHKKLLELGYHKFLPQEILICNSTPLEALKIY